MTKTTKIIITLLLLLFLFGCGNVEETSTPRLEACADYHCFKYEIVYIKGMPCMIVINATTFNGITCDWTQWNEK